MRRFVFVVPAMLWLAAAGAAQGPAVERDPIALSPEQREALQKILAAGDADAKTRVQPAAQKLADVAREIDRNVLSEKPDAGLNEKLRTSMIEAVVELVKIALDFKLAAVSEIGKTLTPEQKKFLLAELEKPGSNPDLTDLVQKKLIERK